MIFAISIITSFLFTFITLPVIIKVSNSINLLDIPDRRKIHYVGTPSLGGAAIFIGMIMAILITVSISDLVTYKYLLVGFCLIFVLGFRDDVSSIKAYQKLIVQIFSAIMVVVFTKIQLTGLYHIAGIDTLPPITVTLISIFVIVAMTNSFNLIDGIDGLAGTIGIIALSFFAWIFLVANQVPLALIAISGCGALIAFLYFNWSPAKIFMGDTGSMILGFLISSMAICAINYGNGLVVNSFIRIDSSVALVMACLIIPIYDTTRVFTIRFSQGRSPLDPDRNHIHHCLLKLDFSHAQATIILATLNIAIIAIALMLNEYLHNGEIILCLMSIMILFGGLLDLAYSRKKFIGKNLKLENKNRLSASKSA